MSGSHRFACAVILAFVATGAAAAQDDAIASWRDHVRELLAEGRERVALGVLAKEIESPTASPEALILFADVASNVGEWDRAEVAGIRLLKEHPQDRRAIMLRARQLWRRGEHAEALRALAPVLAKRPPSEGAPMWDLPAQALAAQIHADVGQDEEARAIHDRIVDESQRIVLRDPDDLVALSVSLVFFGGRGIKLAEKELDGVQKTTKDPEVSVALGRLYVERMYIPRDAAEEFKAALRERPAFVPALLGLAAAHEMVMEGAEARAALEKTAAVNPSDPDVLAVQAREDLGNILLDRAAEKIARGLRSTPKHKRLLSLDAAHALLSGRKEDFERKVGELLTLDPTYGEGLREIAGVLNERRRWPEALDLMARAVAIDGANPAILDDHARYLLYLGQTEAARAELKRADEADAFIHPWRKNILTLLSKIGRRYKTVDTEHFAVKVFDEDLPALTKTTLPFMERSYAILTAKYGYTPAGVEAARNRLVIEAFRTWADFSVRTVGLEGLGALGVCFGPLIAINAPNALPQGEFTWARTFHHELAHTMTLGLSKGRVPRWLTEGLSTYEEAALEPAWTRGMDRELFDAFHTNDLLTVLEFDAAFTTPRIGYAYYQGGLEAGYLVKTYGMDKMIQALRLLGEDLPQDEAYRRAFGVDAAAIDEGFRKHVAERIKPMQMQPRYRPDQRAALEEAWRKAPTDDVLVRLAWARFQGGALADAEALLAEATKRKLDDPRLVLLEARLAQQMRRTDRARELMARLEKSGLRDFDLAFDLGVAAEREGRQEDAIARYREAIAYFPTNADPAGPRPALARLLRGGGNTAEAIAVLEDHLGYAYEDLRARRAVIEAKRASGDKEAAFDHAGKFLMTNPLDAGMHQVRADLGLELGRGTDALLAAECAVQLGATPVAKATGHVAAARALVLLGRRDEARGRAREALDLAPEHAAARELVNELGGAAGAPSEERR